MTPRQLELFDSTPQPGGDQPPLRPTHSARTRPDSDAKLAPDWLTTRPEHLASGAKWREINLGGHTLGFALRRSRRKTIGLSIQDDGLSVQAPGWSTLSQIEQAIREKSTWIIRKLQERAENLRLMALQEAQWRAGGRIPYLGVRIGLHLDGTQDARYIGDPDQPRTADMLSLPLPGDALAERIRDSACAWLQQRARADFEQRLDRYLAMAGSTITGSRLSSACGRWGSCSSTRRIMLNWRLIHFDPSIIDYVVAHEVTHLRIMNHGPEFWRELERLCPEFKSARDALRRHQPATLPLL